MAADADSLRALAEEVNETVILTQEFYSCVVKDPRTKSGDQFRAVRLSQYPPVPYEPKDDE